LCNTTAIDVYTGNGYICGVARLEFTWLHPASEGVLRGTVETEADTIESVLAETFRIGALRVADLYAELVVTNELGPVQDLIRHVICGEDGRVHETAYRISSEILPSGVELTSKVAILNVELSLID